MPVAHHLRAQGLSVLSLLRGSQRCDVQARLLLSGICRPLRRHKLDLAIEEKIFVSNDLEDLRAETLRTEQKLRSDVDVSRKSALGAGEPPWTCV